MKLTRTQMQGIARTWKQLDKEVNSELELLGREQIENMIELCKQILKERSQSLSKAKVILIQYQHDRLKRQLKHVERI